MTNDTLEEVKQKLKTLDEVLLMEVLEVSSEDLVEVFSDRIEERLEQLKGLYD
jgi:hypothetical protein